MKPVFSKKFVHSAFGFLCSFQLSSACPLWVKTNPTKRKDKKRFDPFHRILNFFFVLRSFFIIYDDCELKSSIWPNFEMKFSFGETDEDDSNIFVSDGKNNKPGL